AVIKPSPSTTASGKPDPTEKPNATTSASHTVSHSLIVACIAAARTGFTWLTHELTDHVQGNDPRMDLYFAVSKLLQTAGTGDDRRGIDATLRALKPCNAEQTAYIQGNIEFNGWAAAEAACKEAFYYNAKTLGDVFGLWLSCITPVNLALVASSNK